MISRSMFVLALPLAVGLACSSSRAARTSDTSTARTGDVQTAPPAPMVPSEEQRETLRGAEANSDVRVHSDDQVVEGTVTRLSSDSIAIQGPAGEEKTLDVVPQTLVSIGGRGASVGDLEQGQDVRAAYATDANGRDVAVKIVAGPAETSPNAAPGAPSTGRGGQGGSPEAKPPAERAQKK